MFPLIGDGPDRSFEVGLYIGCNADFVLDPEQFMDDTAKEMLVDYGLELDREDAWRGYDLASSDPDQWCE